MFFRNKRERYRAWKRAQKESLKHAKNRGKPYKDEEIEDIISIGPLQFYSKDCLDEVREKARKYKRTVHGIRGVLQVIENYIKTGKMETWGVELEERSNSYLEQLKRVADRAIEEGLINVGEWQMGTRAGSGGTHREEDIEEIEMPSEKKKEFGEYCQTLEEKLTGALRSGRLSPQKFGKIFKRELYTEREVKREIWQRATKEKQVSLGLL